MSMPIQFRVVLTVLKVTVPMDAPRVSPLLGRRHEYASESGRLGRPPEPHGRLSGPSAYPRSGRKRSAPGRDLGGAIPGTVCSGLIRPVEKQLHAT